jgi:hypothetical protein
VLVHNGKAMPWHGCQVGSMYDTDFGKCLLQFKNCHLICFSKHTYILYIWGWNENCSEIVLDEGVEVVKNCSHECWGWRSIDTPTSGSPLQRIPLTSSSSPNLQPFSTFPGGAKHVNRSHLTLWSEWLLYTPHALTHHNTAFFSRSVSMCSVWFLQWTVTVP